MAPEYEDVHTFVELNLIRQVGEVGKKLHTARSSNDQCNVDMKLYVKEQTAWVIAQIDRFRETLQHTAEANPWIMPGYTHLQRAQVVTMKHHLLAYYEMLGRDKKRLQSALEIMDESPLGCGALAGTTHEIDRAYSAELLGFAGGPCKNFLDGVSDRDFVLEDHGGLQHFNDAPVPPGGGAGTLDQRRVWVRDVGRPVHHRIQHHAPEKEFGRRGAGPWPDWTGVRGSADPALCHEGPAAGLQQGYAGG